MPTKSLVSLIAAATIISLSACGSSSITSTATTPVLVQPVSGEFHSIQPDDLQSHVAEFEANITRTGVIFDGIPDRLLFEDLDTETGEVYLRFQNMNTMLAIIQLDLQSETPVAGLNIAELDSEETAIRILSGDNSAIQVNTTTDGDFVLSGRVSNPVNNEEHEVSLTFNESIIEAGASSIEVVNNDAILNGTLGTSTYVQMRDIIANNPNINRLVLAKSDGSVNDAINMHTGRLIRNASLATYVPADGNINSGAVDLFAAGVTRVVEDGAKLGVHSWCCEGDNDLPADQLPRDDAAHGPQLTYFREMMPDSGVDFYFFTLTSAPADDIHVMTRAEMDQYGLVTAP